MTNSSSVNYCIIEIYTNKLNEEQIKKINNVCSEEYLTKGGRDGDIDFIGLDIKEMKNEETLAEFKKKPLKL